MNKGLLATNLKKIISLVDNLRDIGIQEIIKLPKIVVVGSQSSGKSSLLQQIVGLDFLPRGKGVVTRRPLELRLTYDNTITQPFGVFSQLPRETFTDFDKVRDKINQLTDKLCGNNKNIIDQPIVLNISSPNCPTITIVDLPGITVNPVGDQPQQIYDITKNLVLKYANDPRSILICVIPANQDIFTSQALKIVLEVDPNGLRSLGCLTKIDIMNPGQNARQILLNNVVPLKYGYVGIKNRNNQDVIDNKPVLQSLLQQKQYFSQSPIYSTLPSNTTGTQALTDKITKILFSQIKQLMPHIIKQISMKKIETQSKLNKLGKNMFQTPQQLVNYVWKIISKFLNVYKKSLEGVRDNEVKYEPFGPKLRKLMNELFQNEYLDKATQNLKDKDIQQSLFKYSSSSIPGFVSIDAFLFLLNPILAKLISPPILLIQQIFKQIKQNVVEIINQVISDKYPLFALKFTESVLQAISIVKQQAKSIVTDIIDVQIGYLYTNDLTYLIEDFKIPQQLKKKYESRGYFNPLVYQFRKRLDAFVKIIVRNLRDLIPKQISNIILIKGTQNIEFQIYDFVRNLNKIQQWFQQPQHIRQQRKTILKTLQILQSAEKRIKRDSEFGKYIKPMSYSRKLKEIQNKQSNSNRQNSSLPGLIEQYHKQSTNQKYKTEEKHSENTNPTIFDNDKNPQVQITQQLQNKNKTIVKANNPPKDPLSKSKRKEDVFKLFGFKPS